MSGILDVAHYEMDILVIWVHISSIMSAICSDAWIDAHSCASQHCNISSPQKRCYSLCCLCRRDIRSQRFCWKDCLWDSGHRYSHVTVNVKERRVIINTSASPSWCFAQYALANYNDKDNDILRDEHPAGPTGGFADPRICPLFIGMVALPYNPFSTCVFSELWIGWQRPPQPCNCCAGPKWHAYIEYR